MERVKAIVDYISGLQPEEQEKFLSRISTEQPELVLQVRMQLNQSKKNADQAQADTVELPQTPEGAARTEPVKYIFAPGDLIAGRYRVIVPIAKGGMGEVYEVEDLDLHSRVALKTISLKSAARPGAVEMFRREINLARQVTHPNVCRIYDIGRHEHPEHGELHFLTMELLHGKTLGQRIRTEGTLTKEESLPLLHQMVQALGAAHRLNIAHRDFKSGNVILCEPPAVPGSGPVAGPVAKPPSGSRHEATTEPRPTPSADAASDPGSAVPSAEASGSPGPPSGTPPSSGSSTRGVVVKVTDFGLARSVDGLETTVHGEVWGTPDYMAPEQFHGQSSIASDIYSLGVVMYEMLTGKLPHRSSTGSKTPDGKPSAAMEKIPPEWRPVVKKCMAFEPGDRYKTVDEVWAALNGEKRADVQRKTVFGLAPRTWATMAAALVVVLGLTAWLERDRIHNFLNPPLEPKHIAVLPFHNVGDDPANQAFCDGVAYSLSSKLSQLEQFQQNVWVIPADDARTVHSADEAYRKLNADLVLTGSMERTTTGAVLTINLVDAKNHKQLASRVVTASMGTLDNLQDSTWESAASMINLKVKSAVTEQLAKQDTKEPGAYDFYTQGVGYLQRVHSNSTDLDNAIQLFTRALEKDNKYALAYAGLGRAYALKYFYTRDPQWFDKASWNGRHAVQLDARLAVTRFALGFIYEETGQLDAALTEYRKALELDPAMIEATFHIAEVYEAKGQFQEAEEQYRHAIAARSGFSSAYINLGGLYYRQGKFEAARAQFKAAIDLTPDNPIAYQNLAGVYLAERNYDQAIQVLRSELKLKQTPALWSNLGATLMYVQRYPEAVEAMEQASQLAPHNHLILRNLADSYSQVPSQKTKAAETYRRALAAAQGELKINPDERLALASAGLYEAHLGHNTNALHYTSRALALYPKDNLVLFTAALVYEIIGQRSQALNNLEEAWRSGYPLTEIEREPELNSLRSDSRYQIWLKRAQQSNPAS
jgi:serine/threonine-protein kinase